MKTECRLTILAFFISMRVFSQDITGSWDGVLKIQSMQMRIVFNITKAGDSYTSTMDSPDQGVKGIPVTSTRFENSMLIITIANAGVEYEGVLEQDNTINGNLRQGGQSFPMVLSQSKKEENVSKPQEPKKPYPYYEEEVTFENTLEAVRLAGTLTLPKKDGVFPAVILISGSGPQNRDEELMGHKPFLVLSDFLTKNGIAVLRFDDRGVGASTGNYQSATSLNFARDVEAGVQYLKTRKEINKKKIGLIGHSEGGIIAPMVASNSKDISFIVLLAGTGVPGDQVLLDQQKLIGAASGIDESLLVKSEMLNKGAFEIVKKSNEREQLKRDLTNYLKQNNISDEEINSTVGVLTNPWMNYFIQYEPGVTLEKVKCPVLALNGEKDLQVSAKVNLKAIETSLKKGGNKDVTIKELPGLNHLFQESKTGMPAEYSAIEQTFSPVAMNEILTWIKKQVK
jgi:uncharacterized protein